MVEVIRPGAPIKPPPSHTNRPPAQPDENKSRGATTAAENGAARPRQVLRPGAPIKPPPPTPAPNDRRGHKAPTIYKTHWGPRYHHTYTPPQSPRLQQDPLGAPVSIYLRTIYTGAKRPPRAPCPQSIQDSPPTARRIQRSPPNTAQPAEYSAARRFFTRQKIIPWDYDKSRGKQPRMTTGSYRRQRKTNPTTKITTTRTKRKETRERGGPSLKKPNATVECKNASGGEENAANCL